MDPSELGETSGPRPVAKGFVEVLFLEEVLYTPLHYSLVAVDTIKAVTQIAVPKHLANQEVCKVTFVLAGVVTQAFVQGDYETIFRLIAEGSHYERTG